jgi:uncharacterized protein YbjT (DUF2867 family)
MRALVLGVSGLVGGELYQGILNDPRFEQVVTLSRAPLESHPKAAHHKVNFEQLEELGELFKVDVVFCCLGTTIAKAGTKDAFRKVDFNYPLTAAKLLQNNNPEGSFLVITAMGADSNSSVFYNKTKGELEEALQVLKLGCLVIFKPSLILGKRNESRPLEAFGQRLAKVVDPFLKKILPKLAGVEAWKIAHKMIEVSHGKTEGFRVVESDEIKNVAQSSTSEKSS